MSARATRWVGWATAGVVFAVGLVTLNRDLVGVFYDDALYAGLATALAHGWGYVHPNFPVMPGAVHYPPLYPIVLAPIFGLLPVNTAAIVAKVLNLVLASVAAGLIAWHAVRKEWLGPGVPPWIPAAVVAFMALAMPVLAVQSELFSEPLFGALFAAAILVADAPPSRWSPMRAAVVACILAALAFLTRSIGVALVGGVLLYLFAVKRVGWRVTLAAAVPPLLAGLGWGLWVLTHRGDIDPALRSNYGTYLHVASGAGIHAFVHAVQQLPRPFLALPLGWLSASGLLWVLGVPALAIGAYGLVRSVTRSAIGWTLVGYLGILAFWPFPPDRFIWAVLPWFALVFLSGVVGCLRMRPLRIPVAVIVGCMVIGLVQYQFKGFRHAWWRTAADHTSSTFAPLLPYLRTLPKDAVIATDDEGLVWLYTHRKAVPLYLYNYQGSKRVFPPPAVQRAYLERQGVTHILLASLSGTANQLDTLLGTYPGWLRVVHVWPAGPMLLAVDSTR